MTNQVQHMVVKSHLELSIICIFIWFFAVLFPLKCCRNSFTTLDDNNFSSLTSKLTIIQFPICWCMLKVLIPCKVLPPTVGASVVRKWSIQNMTLTSLCARLQETLMFEWERGLRIVKGWRECKGIEAMKRKKRREETWQLSWVEC